MRKYLGSVGQSKDLSTSRGLIFSPSILSEQCARLLGLSLRGQTDLEASESGLKHVTGIVRSGSC
jgi:hypothetical protein